MARAVAIQALSFYEELAAKNHRGLVPMIFLSHAMPFVRGDIAGFPPKDARAMHVGGQAEPVIAEGTTIPAPAPEREGVPAGEAEEITRLNAIPLDAGIFAEDNLAQISKAIEIKPLAKGDKKPSLEAAQAIIKAELARRDTAAEEERVRNLNGNGLLSSHSGLPVAA